MMILLENTVIASVGMQRFVSAKSGICAAVATVAVAVAIAVYMTRNRN